MMNNETERQVRIAKPGWLKRRLPAGPEYEKIRRLLKGHGLTTVCREAQCPNQFECYSQGTATFMIMGETCTRNCGFCAVAHGPVCPPDPEEPGRVADAVAIMGLRYAVVTSVTRDDLADGGASIFADTIRAIRERMPATLVEVLIPDLQGNWDGLETILRAGPDVLNHNIETVQHLYPSVRPEAVYTRSVDLLKTAKRIVPKTPTKTGIMLGLGESEAELFETMSDLLTAGCDIVTLGQYLQPSSRHLQVHRFIPPDEFHLLREKALQLGFSGVAAGPFVRSSYQAEELYRQAIRSRSEFNKRDGWVNALQTAEYFKRCSMCGETWRTRDEFLNDGTLELEGYGADFDKLENGLFYFTHKVQDCSTTMAIKTSEFLNLYTGEKYSDSKMEGDECPRLCLERNALDRCPVFCEYAFIREIIQIIKARHDVVSGTDRVGR
jgi:lipoyl synthase